MKGKKAREKKTHLGQPRLVPHDELVGRHEHVELFGGHLGVEEVLFIFFLVRGERE